MFFFRNKKHAQQKIYREILDDKEAIKGGFALMKNIKHWLTGFHKNITNC